MTLNIEGLQFAYHGPLIDDATFTVNPGESCFLLGPSGAGKSTILRCIAGLEQPDAGTMSNEGQNLAGVPTHQRHIGMMFQEPALFPHLNVAGNISFALRYGTLPKSQWANDVNHWLEVVGLDGKAQAAVNELSGGERQRVALARSLAARPRAMLLDEPFAALDRALRDRLGNKVKSILHEQQIPALWVTHDEGEAQRLGDHIWRLVDGRLAPA